MEPTGRSHIYYIKKSFNYMEEARREVQNTKNVWLINIQTMSSSFSKYYKISDELSGAKFRPIIKYNEFS